MIADGYIYLLTKSCNLYILDFVTGKTLYKKLFEGTCIDAPLKDGNILYISVGFPKNRVVKFDLSTKTESGQFRDITEQPLYASARLDMDYLYFSSTSGMVYKVARNNISEYVWNQFYNSIINFWNVTVDGDSFYFFPSGNDLKVYRYDRNSNNIVWAKPLVISKPAYKEEIRNSNLRRMGIPYSTRTIGGGSQKPSSGGGSSFAPGTSEASASSSNFATDNSSLCFITGLPAYYFVCIEKITGDYTATVFLNANTGILPIGAPVIKDNLVYYALPVEKKFFIRNKSGQLLNSYDLNGEVYASIVAANAKLFVATNKGAIYAFETSANHAPYKPVITSPVNFSNITTDDVTVSWIGGDPDNDSVSYSLRLTGGGRVEVFENITETSFTLRNLGLNTQYTVEVRAYETNEKKAYSVWSDKITFVYKKFQGIKPLPPDNLNITVERAGDGYNFVAVWEPSRSEGVRGYKITYRKSNGNFVPPQEITTTSYILTTQCNDPLQFGCLEKDENYEFEVKAINIELLESEAVRKTFYAGAPFKINDVPQPTVNLQDVINSANINDTITISATTLWFTHPIVINKPIKIEGQSALSSALIFDGFEKGIIIENILSKISFKPDVVVEISNIAIIGATVGIEINAPTKVTHCIVAKGGTGIIANASSEIINNTIALNSGNGISVNGGTHIIKNNIIVENGGKGITLTAGTINLLKYNLFYGNLMGTSSDNIVIDNSNLIGFRVPFVNIENNDFRETEGSPSVDAGDPADDFSYEPVPNGQRINAGAFGNTPFATKTIIFGSQTSSAGTPGGGCYIKARKNNSYNDTIIGFIIFFLPVYIMLRKMARYLSFGHRE
ncbi:MAG: fibronectin type III domain-containing protein [Planctomycetota bacterium]